MHRRPRVSPNQPLRYKQWVIPAGVAVGMSAYFQHRDPTIFPRPLEFLPERWLDENVTPEMKNAYIPFSRGSRHCLGMKYVSFLFSSLPFPPFTVTAPALHLFLLQHDYKRRKEGKT